MKSFSTTLLFPLLAVTPAFSQDLPVGIEQRLVSFIHQGEAVSLPANPSISLRFENDRRVSGRASINRYFGEYHLDRGGNFHWAHPGLASTRMAGPEELMRIESQYFQALGSVRFLTFTATKLFLESTDKSTMLEFETTSWEAIQAALKGKKLVLARMIADGNEIQLPAEPLLDMTLGENGRVHGFSGVNQYHSSYTLTSENDISFGACSLTRRAGSPELL